MLHSKVYNTSLTPEMRTALIARDAAYFEKQIRILCALVNARERFPDDQPYDELMSQLFICIALEDSLIRSGETLQFLADMINF
jgi:hypothetical protein